MAGTMVWIRLRDNESGLCKTKNPDHMIGICGAPSGTRTLDTLIKSQLL